MIRIDERYLTNDTIIKIMTELNYDLTPYKDDNGEINFIMLRQDLAVMEWLHRITRRRN